MSNRRQPTNPHAAAPPRAYWNGLPTTAMRGTAVVAEAPEFPQYWAKREGLIGKRINVVWVNLEGVNSGGGECYLDDRDGSGWRKVTEGHGSPSYPHADLAIADGSFRPHRHLGRLPGEQVAR